MSTFLYEAISEAQFFELEPWHFIIWVKKITVLYFNWLSLDAPY